MNTMTESLASDETSADSMEDAIIVTRELSKMFGAFKALSKCSLSVGRGEIFGLLGPNGAGKTTLIRLLMGFISPSSGGAKINGLDCYRNRVNVHRHVSYLPGDARLFRAMTGRGVLKFFSQIRKDADLKRAKAIADRLELDLSRWVAFMSTGMRQKLALAVALSIDCPLIILDEPTANLDPTVRGEVLQIVAEAKREGKTVMLSSHVLSEIEEVCDRVGILRTGQLVHLQSIRQLKQQHRIRAELTGAMPDLPDAIKSDVTISENGGWVQIETPGELSILLKWLAAAPLTNVHIEPVGLRAVYDRFHSKNLTT